jgi:hypothetical protein
MKKGLKNILRTILFWPTGDSDFDDIYTTLGSLGREYHITLGYAENKLFEVLDNIEGLNYVIVINYVFWNIHEIP